MMVTELSRPIALDRIGVKEKTFEIEASRSECVAIAKRLDIPELRRMTARLTVKRVKGGQQVRLQGRVMAELVQICVVSLEPTTSIVDESFERFYAVETEKDDRDIVIDVEDDDPPDPVVDGHIDIGEAAADHLALAMDPFPRAPDACFTPPPSLPAEEPIKPNPFEILAEHRKKV